MKNKILLLIIVLGILPNFVSAFLVSDQGTNVREVATGNLTALANLTISIYDSATGGNLIFEQNSSNAIANGSWNFMINPNLEYGKSYWKDYQINGEDLDFDGNERLEIQSSFGKINNVSFINFSLINSCSEGSSIRLIYENGSVLCETDDSGSTETNLTNYALKNQSETFIGNLTTSGTGFFGWLGSLASRITKLFVQDIDASGNVNVSGNVTATKYCNSTSCYSIAEFLGSGAESDPIFIAENSTLWSAINSKLAGTDQRYNDTVLIISVNKTSNIMSLGFYNKSEVDNLISSVSGGNSSWNQSLANTLYYLLSNPLNFINITTGQVFNDTTLILTVNSSLWSYITSNEASWLSTTYNATYATWAYNQTTGANAYTDTQINANMTLSNLQNIMNASGIYSTYNATYDAKVSGNASWNQTLASTLYAPISLTGDNSSWNESYANTKYAGIQWGYNMTTPFTNWLSTFAYNYNQTTPAISVANAYTDTASANLQTNITNVNTSLSSRIDGISPGNSSFNQSLTDSLYSEKKWNYNQTYSGSTYNATYATWAYNQTYSGSTYNATYDAKVSGNASWNQTLASTLYAPISLTGDNSSWNETYANTKYLGISDQRYNETTIINAINTTSNIDSLGFLNKSGTNANQNININQYNITTSGTGFFGWLGSLTSRITKLWVVDVNATGNIQTSGNITATYVKLGGVGYMYDNGTSLILGRD